MKIDSVPTIKIDSVLMQHQQSGKGVAATTLVKKHRRIVMRLAVPLLILVWLLVGGFVTDTYTVLSFNGDPKLVTLANESGMNMKGKALFLSKSPEIIDADELHIHCPMENDESIEYGCYKPAENKIYILRIESAPYSEISATTAAHEMLHVAWRELPTRERNDIASALREHSAQKNDTATVSVKTSLAQYDKSEEVQINELHSFLGSEVDDVAIDTRIDDHYDKYFSDRSKSTHAKQKFDQGIDSIEASIEARRKEVEAKENELTDYANKWLYPIKAYMQQNLYYRDYARYNANVDAYNNNLKNYKSKYNEYGQLIQQLNTDIGAYNNAISAMMPSKKQATIHAQASE